MVTVHQSSLGLGTLLIHADERPREQEAAVAPPISVSTTYKHVEGEGFEGIDLLDPHRHVYARYTTPNSIRVEKLLSEIMHGYALTYSSGQAATTAAIAHFQPSRVAICKGYPGTHGLLQMYKRQNHNFAIIDLDDDFKEGDICWLETPLNPTGIARDIKYYANKVHAVGGQLIVDSTFGPPPLQDPFEQGADCVFHSGSKYLGGHSDLLCGVLVVKALDRWQKMHEDRVHLGAVLGSLEQWLLLRSLRTLHLRVTRQAASALELVTWIHTVSKIPKGQEDDGVKGGVVTKVYHCSLQKEDRERAFDPRNQMPGGFSPTFAILLDTAAHAQSLPFRTNLFAAATSLGGVESLMEYRAAVYPSEDPLLVRISVGLEDVEDLKSDLRKAFASL